MNATATRRYELCFYVNGDLAKSIPLTPGSAGNLKQQAKKFTQGDNGPIPMDWVIYGEDERDQVAFGHYNPN